MTNLRQTAEAILELFDRKYHSDPVVNRHIIMHDIVEVLERYGADRIEEHRPNRYSW